jgi:predicted lipid-binding transport protein (Tim44 family)
MRGVFLASESDMQRFLSLTMAVCLSLTMSLDVLAAKRLGGAKSFGTAPSHQTQMKQTQPVAGNSATAARPAAATGASRWLGPLAGIAAGGLLASLFMGDGFQGLQLFDILIFGLIAFVLFRLFAARRQPAMAGTAAMSREAATSGNLFGSAASALPRIQAPAWFDADKFIEQGRQHFLALQQHWDANEMDKISEFFTPQMTQFLKQERLNLGDGFQSTYIDDLQVQLDGIDDNPTVTVATLTFSGLAKTSRFDQGEAFCESWRLERAAGDNQPWLVAGIRQNG